VIFRGVKRYFCTSCLYVAQDLWTPDQNISAVQASWMFVFGYVASMVGKACAGPWADLYGGKIVMGMSAGGFLFFITMFAYVPQICDFLGVPKMRLFGADEPNYFPEFLVVWFLNGFFALGLSWVAIVAIAGNWIPSSHTGRLMAILGLAPELGDSWARYYLSPVVDETGSWQAVLLSAARISLLICIPMFLLVSDSPAGGEEDDEGAAEGAVGTDGQGAAKKTKKPQEPFRDRVKKLFTDSPLITLLMTMCAFLYAIRTMFLLYSVNYLSHVLCGHILSDSGKHKIGLEDLQGSGNPRVDSCVQDKATVAQVATASAWYTVFGCAGVYLSGVLKDFLPKRHRATILMGNIVILICALGIMKFWKPNEISFELATLAVGLVGYAVFGAYKTSTGAFAVDIGGKHMKATCTALMGFSSNGAAALIIICKGWLGGNWDVLFSILIGLGFCALFAATAIYRDDLKKLRPALVNAGALQEPLVASAPRV